MPYNQKKKQLTASEKKVVNEYVSNLKRANYYLKKANDQKYGSVNYLYGVLSSIKYEHKALAPDIKELQMSQKSLYKLAKILHFFGIDDVDW